MAKSCPPRVDHSQRSVAASLAAREAVMKLSMDSEQTLRYLNGRQSTWDNCEDKALLTALSILQKRFRSLKSEIYRADEQQPSSTDLFRFLAATKSDSSAEILRRYAKENTPKHIKHPAQKPIRDSDRHQWRELEVSSSRENLPAPVPSDVPPFSVPPESPRALVKDR
ncbi:hypothetical protein AAVH_12301 [Aphelenchoides avenae]|nr:hypothetical protein AAVH_12301 [Aphelenchus avenae]